MNIIHSSEKLAELEQLISTNCRADYVYMYPPRQAYRPTGAGLLDSAVMQSLRRPVQLNLYFHFPFCRQICSFCNLYTMVDAGADVDNYVEVMLKELHHYAPQLRGRRVDTLYLG